MTLATNMLEINRQGGVHSRPFCHCSSPTAPGLPDRCTLAPPKLLEFMMAGLLLSLLVSIQCHSTFIVVVCPSVALPHPPSLSDSHVPPCNRSPTLPAIAWTLYIRPEQGHMS